MKEQFDLIGPWSYTVCSGLCYYTLLQRDIKGNIQSESTTLMDGNGTYLKNLNNLGTQNICCNYPKV